jgi:hypothetical protein
VVKLAAAKYLLYSILVPEVLKIRENRIYWGAGESKFAAIVIFLHHINTKQPILEISRKTDDLHFFSFRLFKFHLPQR